MLTPKIFHPMTVSLPAISLPPSAQMPIQQALSQKSPHASQPGEHQAAADQQAKPDTSPGAGQQTAPLQTQIQHQLVQKITAKPEGTAPGPNITSTFSVQESPFPYPKPGIPIALCQQYAGYSFLFQDNPAFLERANSTNALEWSLMKNRDLFNQELRQAGTDKSANEKLKLGYQIGKLIWNEYEKGRSGKITGVEDLFRPTLLFSDATRQQVLKLLDAAVQKGMISPEVGDRALNRLFVTIPLQDVGALLDDGKMTISCYKAVSFDDGKPVITRRIEVHPMEGMEFESHSCQVYESRVTSSSYDEAFMSALNAHIDACQWSRNTTLLPEPPEYQQLINDPQAALQNLPVCRLTAPALSPVQNHVRNLVLSIRAALVMQRQPTASEETREIMRRNTYVLQGRLTRFLMANLKNTTPIKVRQCYYGLFKEVAGESYAQAVAALNSAIAHLPEKERRHHVGLLHDCLIPVARCHAGALAAGERSPLIKTLDAVARTVESVMPH